MNARSAQDHPNPRRAGVDLRHHLRFFVHCASDHEYDDILRLVTCRSAAFNERVLLLFQSCLDEILKRGFQARGMLGINIFDSL